VSDVVEQYTIRPIPESQRHGTARSLFPFWFTANSSAFTVVLGAVGVELGLGVVPCIIAIVLGGAVGGVFMAYHSAQGPKLGLTQQFEGPAASALSGADISWLVGFIVAGGLYYLLTPHGTSPAASARPTPEAVVDQ
jgi:NCS1 family nucleobase:cation symporter-1